MPIFTDMELRDRAQKEMARDREIRRSYSTRSGQEILLEASRSYSETAEYDMFLSHSIRDSELILGVKASLEDLGYKPYVDWVDDPQLDRNNVTSRTAELLRKRMQRSRALLYVTTKNADDSRWMPWECGYFDGFREKVAIVPILSTRAEAFYGLEYLGLYPYCMKNWDTSGRARLWVHRDAKTYLLFDSWVEAKNVRLAWQSL